MNAITKATLIFNAGNMPTDLCVSFLPDELYICMRGLQSWT